MAKPRVKTKVQGDLRRDAREVRRVIIKALENWSALDADANRELYTSSGKAVFFDFTPMQYVGWRTYVTEIKKVQTKIRKFQIKVNSDMRVHVLGKLAFGHCTWAMNFVFANGVRRRLAGRLTEVLEKRGGKWIIVHEHASVPTQ